MKLQNVENKIKRTQMLNYTVFVFWTVCNDGRP